MLLLYNIVIILNSYIYYLYIYTYSTLTIRLDLSLCTKQFCMQLTKAYAAEMSCISCY